MNKNELIDCLERSPVIAAFHEKDFKKAIDSPCEVIFNLKASLHTVKQQIAAAHEAGKFYFLHVDLADGIGKDKTGIEYLTECGVDGIISTRSQLIKYAKEAGLLTIQRFFVIDRQGIESIRDMLDSSSPDLIEIMPGVIGKVINRFSYGSIPVIAGGLIQTKVEVTDALKNGAAAVSTGTTELWYL